jgi:hypothetical protein
MIRKAFVAYLAFLTLVKALSNDHEDAPASPASSIEALHARLRQLEEIAFAQSENSAEALQDSSQGEQRCPSFEGKCSG